ncbi:hypothetical protein CKA32_006186 [Geitlerinema sp. FC II]|nr:hypothetical protein CKA32_006186 [Geitlerinema sp. FC II]
MTSFVFWFAGSFPTFSPQGDGNSPRTQRKLYREIRPPPSFPTFSPQGDGNKE